MSRRLRILIGCMLLVFALQAQEMPQTNLIWGLEAGAHFFISDLNSQWPVRQSQNPYYGSYNYDNTLYSDANGWQVAVKPEYRFGKKGMFGITSGIQFGQLNTEVSKDGYFFLRYSNDEITEFARVVSMQEKSSYLGIPVVFRYSPLQTRGFGLYGKAGFEFNFQVSSKLDVEFLNSEMEAREQEILEKFDTQTNRFYSTFFWSVGMKLGKPGQLNLNMEILLPSAVLTSNNSALVDLDGFSGFHISLQAPLQIFVKSRQ